MILSDEQMGAVRHGLHNDTSWIWHELPIGPQPLPSWAKGLRVDFMMGYANRPNYRIKANDNLRDWPGKVFRREGNRYMAVTGDGRAEVYYHGGAISEVTLRRFRRVDGSLHQYRRDLSGDACDPRMEPGDWVDVPMLATTQESGFGGSQFELQMDDGTVVVLRGPWHGGAPTGYVETAFTNTADKYFRCVHRPGQTWWQTTGMGGLFITEDLFTRLLARFAPECRCARVTDRFGSHLEAVRGDWDEPKHMVYERERAARKVA